METGGVQVRRLGYCSAVGEGCPAMMAEYSVGGTRQVEILRGGAGR